MARERTEPITSTFAILIKVSTVCDSVWTCWFLKARKDWDEVDRLFEEAKNKNLLSSILYTVIIDVYAKRLLVDKAEAMFQEMTRAGD